MKVVKKFKMFDAQQIRLLNIVESLLIFKSSFLYIEVWRKHCRGSNSGVVVVQLYYCLFYDLIRRINIQYLLTPLKWSLLQSYIPSAHLCPQLTNKSNFKFFTSDSDRVFRLWYLWYLQTLTCNKDSLVNSFALNCYSRTNTLF